MKEIVILGSARTPIGSFQGALASFSGPKLGAIAIKAALQRAGVKPEQIQNVTMGSVLQGGLGQAPARQASIFAGIPTSAGALTINKVCSSGLKSVMNTVNEIRCDEYEVGVAGGMESMTNAPYILTQARAGYRMGNGKLIDLMIHDGLWDPYGDKHMGACAETCVAKYGFTREEQDAFSKESYLRAQAAVNGGLFAKEIAPVEIESKKGTTIVEKDEEPFAAPLDKMGKLKPAFQPDGTVTAANASKISDGAAALVISSADWAQKNGIKPVARIVASSTMSQDPEWFTTAPGGAIAKVLTKAGLKIEDIDLVEVNEAFAAVAMAAMRDAKIPHEKLNVNGGAVALGHPIGSSGARILVSVIHALQARGGKRGLVAICNGGGEATSMIVELV